MNKKEYMKIYRVKNKKHIAEVSKLWELANKDKRKIYRDKRDKIKHNEYNKEWYHRNKKRVIKQLRRRWKQPEYKKRKAIADRKYYMNNRRKIAIYKASWQRENRNRVNLLFKKRYRLNKERHLARTEANRLIKIKVGYLCELCKSNLAEHRHHPDYSKPLEVMLICRSCHLKIHNKEAILI